MSPFFPPRWVGGLPDTVVKISKTSDVMFDESVKHFDDNGFTVINRIQNRDINFSLKAWQTVKFVDFALDNGHITQKKFGEFNYIYLRSLFEDEAPEPDERFNKLCRAFIPYHERYINDISLFNNDLCSYIVGYYEKRLEELIRPLVEHAAILIYYNAAILFKDKKNEAELRRYLEPYL